MYVIKCSDGRILDTGYPSRAAAEAALASGRFDRRIPFNQHAFAAEAARS